MKIISWNMAHRHEPWRCLLGMGIDLALLQEAGKPPPDVAERIQADPAIEVDNAPWETMIVGGRPSYRTVIVKLSNRIKIDWIEARSIETEKSRELVASGPAAAGAARQPDGPARDGLPPLAGRFARAGCRPGDRPRGKHDPLACEAHVRQAWPAAAGGPCAVPGQRSRIPALKTEAAAGRRCPAMSRR